MIIKIDQNQERFEKLVKLFIAELDELNGTSNALDYSYVKSEAESYLYENRSTFAFQNELNDLYGFITLKNDQGTFWVEWMFVDDGSRRQGVASQLFRYAEQYSNSLGQDRLYIWVHPSNVKMLKFLNRMGYNALNLLEVTKKSGDYYHVDDIVKRIEHK